MAFDFFLACVRNGETATFRRALFEEIMGRNAIDPRFPLHGVEYGEGDGSAIYGADDDDIEGLMFNHFGPGVFFERLWELANRTGSFFFWPDEGRNVAVTNLEMLGHLPADACRDFAPYVVKNGNELYWALGGVDPADVPPHTANASNDKHENDN